MRLVHLRRRSCPSQGRFRGLLDKGGRGRRSVGPLACGMLAAICRRESPVPAKASAEPCDAAGPLPRFPRSAADARPPCSACLPICPGGGAERRIREGPRGPASPPNCRRRADAARNSVGMSRVRRAPGNSPAALERACGRWGSKRGGGGERSPWPPRRARTRRGGSGSRCAGGTGGRSITPKGGLFPAGWWDGALGMLET